MATSGVYLFNPTVAEFVDEAFERCRLLPRDITPDHIVSARRSMNFMLKSWQNRGVRQWAMEEEVKATTVGMESFTVEPYTIDIFSMVMKRGEVVTPMVAISREDYHTIHDKTLQGRPDRYFFQRDRDSGTVFIWQAGENTTDQIRYWRFRQLEVVGKASNTVDIPDRWADAFASGLAARLAEKYAPDLEGGLVAKARIAFDEAKIEDRQRAPLIFRPRMGRR